MNAATTEKKPTTTTTPTDTTPTAPTTTTTPTDDKLVTFKEIKYDLSNLGDVLNLAIALDVLTPAQRQAFDVMRAGNMELSAIAMVIAPGLTKDVKAGIKAAQRPDHDAIWYATTIQIGGQDRTIANVIADMRRLADVLNVSASEYNELNKDTSANIRAFTIDGGSSRKYATRETNDRSYVRLARALIERKITTLYFNAGETVHKFNIRQQNTDGTIILQFLDTNAAWRAIDDLNKETTALNKARGVSAPDTWRAVYVKIGDDKTPIGEWFDANVKPVTTPTTTPTDK